MMKTKRQSSIPVVAAPDPRMRFSEVNILDKLVAPKQIEEEKKVPVVQANPRMVELYENLMKHTRGYAGGETHICFAAAIDMVKHPKYTANEIEQFSLQLADLSGESFAASNGLFFSALIETSPDWKFVIHTSGHAEVMRTLGYRNRKKVTIHGPAGDAAGNVMKGGALIINGDAGDYLGIWMSDGRITVNGNAGNNSGAIGGGELIIHGNCGEETGLGMQGGRIQIFGTIAGLALANSIDGGDLYQYERALFLNGKKVAKPRNKP